MVDWKQVLNNVVAVPPVYRNPVNANVGQFILRCSRSDLDALLVACGDAGYPNPDKFDYMNIALYSGSGNSRPETEMAFLRRVIMQRDDWGEPIRHKIGFQAACPQGASCESAVWCQPDIPGFTWIASKLEQGRAYWIGEIEQHAVASSVSSDLIAEAWHSALGSYRFHYTCRELALQVQETRRRGVGDCRALSALLAAELQTQGIETRIRNGFLFGGRRGRAHQWIEAIDTDGKWKVLDLSTAIHARDFALADYANIGFGSLSKRVIAGQASVAHLCGGGTLRVMLDIGR